MIDIKDLQEVRDFKRFNISQIVIASAVSDEEKLKEKTILTKINRGTELDVKESKALTRSITECRDFLNTILKRKDRKKSDS